MTRGYTQIVEGDWIEPSRRGFVHQCCDCHLVHVTHFAVVDKDKNPIPGATVQFKLRIDRRKTAASRRKLKFTKEQD
jgi:Zn-finger protein